MARERVQSTVFHITHWKSGSQWVAEILKYSAPERFVRYVRQNDPQSLTHMPVTPGNVYGTVYFDRKQFRATVQDQILPALPRGSSALTNWWNFAVKKYPYRVFVIVRDLRDTLVSLYFSIKHSHQFSEPAQLARREKLLSMDEESGFLQLLRGTKTTGIGSNLGACAEIQLSWLDAPGVLYLRYEDILGAEREFFERVIDYCEIDVPRERLHHIVDNNIFERVTGRPRGQEDVQSHLRRGIAGDWRNYFTDEIKAEFKQRFGEVLIKTGYEQDLNW